MRYRCELSIEKSKSAAVASATLSITWAGSRSSDLPSDLHVLSVVTIYGSPLAPWKPAGALTPGAVGALARREDDDLPIASNRPAITRRSPALRRLPLH